jgi:hypothetical protein
VIQPKKSSLSQQQKRCSFPPRMKLASVNKVREAQSSALFLIDTFLLLVHQAQH